MLDVTELKRSQALASAQASLLEFIAAGAALPDALERIVRFVEEQSEEDLLASILLLDRDGLHLRHGAAPSLPDFWCEAVDGIAIGPNVGSCGTAAFRRERVWVSDIATDPLWEDYCELAAKAGLGACWSTPFFAIDGALLGTFALYYREPHECVDADDDLVALATHLTGIAIERARSGEAARESQDRYRDLFENANEPIGTVTMDDEITEVNRRVRARARLHARRADRHEPGRSSDAAGARGGAAGDRAQARRRAGHDLRAGVHRQGRARRGARGLEPRDRGGRPPDRRAGHLPGHHRAQAGRDRAAPSLGREPAPLAARQPHRHAQPRELPRAGRERPSGSPTRAAPSSPSC